MPVVQPDAASRGVPPSYPANFQSAVQRNREKGNRSAANFLSAFCLAASESNSYIAAVQLQLEGARPKTRRAAFSLARRACIIVGQAGVRQGSGRAPGERRSEVSSRFYSSRIAATVFAPIAENAPRIHDDTCAPLEFQTVLAFGFRKLLINFVGPVERLPLHAE